MVTLLGNENETVRRMSMLAANELEDVALDSSFSTGSSSSPVQLNESSETFSAASYVRVDRDSNQDSDGANGK